MIAAREAVPLLYPTERFADVTGIPRERVRRQIRAGHIKATKIGRRLYVPAAELERLVAVAEPTTSTTPAISDI